jgi:ubiquitin-protein ligase
MAKPVHKRVLRDITDAKASLPKEFGIYVEPEEDNFYHVHFLISGPPDTPFEGGLYHGMIVLNDHHPLCAPNIHMFTPTGRFVCDSYPVPGTSRGICTTDTAYHPEKWTPLKNICTILKGFVSLMCDKYESHAGGIQSTSAKMKQFAKESLNTLANDAMVQLLFPEIYQSIVDGTFVPFGTETVKQEIPVIDLRKPKKQKKKVIDSEEESKRKSKKKGKAVIESDSESEEEIELVKKKPKKRTRQALG